MDAQHFINEAKRKEQQKLWDDAILDYEKARVLEPSSKEILLSLSRLYLFRNKPIQSLEVLHDLNNIKDDPDVLLQLSSTYMSLNRFDDAERILLEAIHLHPTAPLLNNLGVVSIRLNKRNEAIKCLSEALSLDEKNINTWFNLATYYESQSDLEKALSVLKKAKEAQFHPDLMERYAQVLARKKRYTEAINETEDTLKSFPSHQGLHRTKLKILFMEEKYDQCKAYLEWLENENMIDLDIKKEMLEIKEQVFFHLQQFDYCLKTIDELILLSNNNPVYFLRKAFVYKAQKDYSNALKWLSHMLKTHPLPSQLRSEGILMMKSIEMDNWKHFAFSLFSDNTFKDALMQNPVYAIQSRGIMLPEEGVALIVEWIKNPGSPKFFSFSDSSESIN